MAGWQFWIDRGGAFANIATHDSTGRITPIKRLLPATVIFFGCRPA
jgi:hypothetical protein